MTFRPNAMTFAQGIERIQSACKAAKLDIHNGIVTSKTAAVQKSIRALEVTNIPKGFTKFQLPVSFEGATQTYMSFGAPRTKVPLHSHDEGAGIRVIMFGSIEEPPDLVPRAF